MDVLEWDGEDIRDPIDWGDAEFLPFFGRSRPSPSRTIANRLLPGRRPPVPIRPAPVRPAPVTTIATSPATAPAAVLAQRIRELDDRHRSIAGELATLQQRTAFQQSSEQFGPMATSAVGGLALGFKNGDLFTPAMMQVLPLIQLLTTSRGRALTSGFNANPWSTLGFPAAALLLMAFRHVIPGLAPPKVGAPTVERVLQGNDLVVLAQPASGTVLTFTVGERANPPVDPTDTSTPFAAVLRLNAGQVMKLRPFIGKVPGEILLFAAPEPPVGNARAGAIVAAAPPAGNAARGRRRGGRRA